MAVSFWILILTAVAVMDAALATISLRQRPTGERRFIDEYGRERYFHGVNAIVKGPPWVPETSIWDGDISLNEKDLDDLQSLGMNVIRLGSMWPGVEPEEGQYSDEYINKLMLIVDNAAERDIFTILDMHQDVISERFCGEGVPNWVIDKAIGPDTQEGGSSGDTFPAPKFDNTTYTDRSVIDGFPTRSDCARSSWASYYSTYDASASFDALYSNVNGLLDSWGQFWAKLATEFKGRKGLLGYELINEPWAGDVFADPRLIIPSVADKNRLQPAYDALSAAIRAVDDVSLIFFAAVTWDDPVPAGFTAAPGGAEQADRAVFAYHYYEPPQFNEEIYFNTRVKDAQRLQVGSMVTEFERPEHNDEFTAEDDQFFAAAAVMDQYLQSWSAWELKTFCKETEETLQSDSQNAAFGACKTGYGSTDWLWDASGNLNENTSKKLARTYAMAVAGNATHLHFNQTTSAFHVAYEIDTTCNAPTLIFAHQQLQYPGGMVITAKPQGAVEWTVIEGSNILEVSAAEATFGQLVEVSISAL